MKEKFREPCSVGDLAKRSGVAVSTIHFYESKGLIQGWRTDGNQRRYSRKVLRRIAFIRVAQQAGIPLSAIKDQLANYPNDRPLSKDDWVALVSGWKALLEDRIASLARLRDNMTDCIGCGCLSLAACPLRNPDDALAREGAGPRLLARDRGEPSL